MFEAGAQSAGKFPTLNQIAVKKHKLKRTLNLYEEADDEELETFDLIDLLPNKGLLEQDLKDTKFKIDDEVREDVGFSEVAGPNPDTTKDQKPTTEEKEEIYSSIYSELSSKPKMRGPDIDWVEEADYENTNDFEASHHKHETSTLMSARRTWDDKICKKVAFVCKFGRKKGFKRCLKQLKVCFMHKGGQVAVWSNKKEHLHEANNDDLKKYIWSDKQTEIIEKFMMMPMRKSPIQLMEKLKENGATSRGKYPTLMQIHSKKVHMIAKTKGKTNQTIPGKERGRPSKKFLSEIESTDVITLELEEAELVKADEYEPVEAESENAEPEEADPDLGESEEVEPEEVDAEEADPINAELVETEAGESEVEAEKAIKYEDENPSKMTSALCSPCGDGVTPALHYCLACEEAFCSGCNSSHGRLRVARGHRVVGVAGPCTPCMEQGREVGAVAHCTECRDFHCSSCSSQHARFKATRGHTLTILTHPQPLPTKFFQPKTSEH